jgi:hypothetical protein
MQTIARLERKRSPWGQGPHRDRPADWQPFALWFAAARLAHSFDPDPIPEEL